MSKDGSAHRKSAARVRTAGRRPRHGGKRPLAAPLPGRRLCWSTLSATLLCTALQVGCAHEPAGELSLVAAAANRFMPSALSSPAVPTPAALRRADFAAERPSRQARSLADWVLASADHDGLPFVVIDKREARLYLFDAAGHLRGAAPVLLGLAAGDDSVPGIGERPLAEVRPEERTTPAGRFLAEPGRNLDGEDVFWVDYEAAVSMHRVRATKPAERRLERLASATALDNRISYGCINLPAAFYDEVLGPALRATPGVVYVLPETRSLRAQFEGYRTPLPKARTVPLAEAGARARPLAGASGSF